MIQTLTLKLGAFASALASVYLTGGTVAACSWAVLALAALPRRVQP